MGIVQTKALIRNYVWFVGIDEAVEKAVRNCSQCQANTDRTQATPNQMTKMPAYPWEQIGVDFKGPLSNGHYLMVVVDDFSRYPVVHKIAHTTFKTVSKHLAIIFSEFGVPRVLKSDNGPPFQSHQFKMFAEQQGFTHRRITPMWPQANATCERFMRNLGKVVRCSNSTNWEDNLTEYLRNYRATPHCSTGVPPRELLFKGAASTAKLPVYNNDNNNDNDKDSEVEVRAKANDERAKVKMAAYNDKKRSAKPHNFKVGDFVLLKRKPTSKSEPAFDPNPFVIKHIKHNMATIARTTNQREQELARDVSLLQLYYPPLDMTPQQPTPTINTPPPTPATTNILDNFVNTDVDVANANENGTDENGTDENGMDENGTDENGMDENETNESAMEEATRTDTEEASDSDTATVNNQMSKRKRASTGQTDQLRRSTRAASAPERYGQVAKH
jgi:hypothetical protein